MRELDKTKIYDLSELTSEELDKLFKGTYCYEEHKSLKYYAFEHDSWCITNIASEKLKITNAKELFYTLENIQVDCRELTKEQIKEMAYVFEEFGFKKGSVIRSYTKLYYNSENIKTTITYEKFMELFADQPKEEKPKHYSKGIDTFARMEANCTKEECLAFAKGNIDKYNWREKGQDLEDYKKIVSYANWAIKLLKDEK